MWMVITCSYVKGIERSQFLVNLAQSCLVTCSWPYSVTFWVFETSRCQRGRWLLPTTDATLLRQAGRWHAENKQQNSLVVHKQVRNNSTQTTSNTKACHSRGVGVGGGGEKLHLTQRKWLTSKYTVSKQAKLVQFSPLKKLLNPFLMLWL